MIPQADRLREWELTSDPRKKSCSTAQKEYGFPRAREIRDLLKDLRKASCSFPAAREVIASSPPTTASSSPSFPDAMATTPNPTWNGKFRIRSTKSSHENHRRNGNNTPAAPAVPPKPCSKSPPPIPRQSARHSAPLEPPRAKTPPGSRRANAIEAGAMIRPVRITEVAQSIG